MTASPPGPTLHINTGSGRLGLQFVAELASFDAARRALAEFLEGAGVSPRGLHRAELIFEEICVNVIRYGDSAAAPGSIELDAQVGDDGIVLTITDDARPFDPTAAPAYQPATQLAEAAVGGRGIALVRLASRRMQYERLPGRNRLTVLVDR